MDGKRTTGWPGIVLAGVLGSGCLALLLWGRVTVGAGDSAGFERPVRDIVRAANRTLVLTGWSDGWRIAAWACGAAALAGAVVLVWLASRVRDEPLLEVEDRATGSERAGERVDMNEPNGDADAGSDLALRASDPAANESGATGLAA